MLWCKKNGEAITKMERAWKTKHHHPIPKMKMTPTETLTKYNAKGILQSCQHCTYHSPVVKSCYSCGQSQMWCMMMMYDAQMSSLQEQGPHLMCGFVKSSCYLIKGQTTGYTSSCHKYHCWSEWSFRFLWETLLGMFINPASSLFFTWHGHFSKRKSLNICTVVVSPGRTVTLPGGTECLYKACYINIYYTEDWGALCLLVAKG